MTRLVLVRHGEAQSHVDHVVGGDRGCTGLSDLGRRQAHALRQRWERTAASELGDVSAIYASTLPRALETAEIVAPALGLTDVKTERDLREWDPGEEADCATWEELEQRYPRDEWSAHASRFPGAETWAEFGLRVGRVLHDLADRHAGQTIVVACHGGVIEQSAIAFLGLSHHGELVSFDIDNCSITEWYRPDPEELWWRPSGRWRLLRLNDAAHLEGHRPGDR